YLLAAIVVPQGQALYHWQEIGVDADAKVSAVEAFCGQLANVIQPLMTGCRFRVLAPNAFHAALRVADRELREFSLEAAVASLSLANDIGPTVCRQRLLPTRTTASKRCASESARLAKTTVSSKALSGRCLATTTKNRRRRSTPRCARSVSRASRCTR